MGKRERRTTRIRGAVLVEMSIVTPILLLLTLGAVQAGLAFNQYMRILDAVHAGMRIGQKQINLPFDSVTTTFLRNGPECFIGLSNPAHESSFHMSIHRRVNRMLCLEDLPLWEVTISSTRVQNGSSGSVVKVQIAGIVQSWLPGLNHLPIAVEASGPYLVGND